MKKLKWKKAWFKEYNVTKNFLKNSKYSTFRITKYISNKNDIFYFTSTSPKRTCGTSHVTFGMAYQFGNKGFATYSNKR